MNDIKNWTEITRGLYRYVVTSKVCYEIHIIEYTEGQNISEIPANLYLAGDCRNGQITCFKRQLLVKNNTVKECISTAMIDYAARTV